MSLEHIYGEISRPEVNKYARQEFWRYQNLDIFGHHINCPYYIDTPVFQIIEQMREALISEEQIARFYNLHKMDISRFGRYSGKGTPSEIEDATKSFLQDSFDLSSITNEGVIQLMRLKGLGVDCSGVVFNVLSAAFEKVGFNDIFLNTLNWDDLNRKDARRAGTRVFGGSASYEIKPKEVRELDLVIMPKHVAVVLLENNRLIVCQSTPWTFPDGVNVSSLEVVDNVPIFDLGVTMGKDWNQKFTKNELSFRRLKIFS